jgi:methionyl-tRNA formyltransferase
MTKTATKPSIVFFGSFQHYSVQIVDQILKSGQFNLLAVVTTPPKPAGRDQILTKTPVHLWAETNGVKVFTPEKLDNNSLNDLAPSSQLPAPNGMPDFFLVAGYSKLLPPSWLSAPKYGSINVHFSLLPKYRGAMPVEWAIFMGETETGVSVIEMSPEFDKGNIISQARQPITPNDTRQTLYQKLYDLGGKLAIATLPIYLKWKIGSEKSVLMSEFENSKIENCKLILPPLPQPPSNAPYARLLSKSDTFINWEIINSATKGLSLPDTSQLPKLFLEAVKTNGSLILNTQYLILLERSVRSFEYWPGLWTFVNTNKGQKRLKILSASIANNKLVLDQVQLEGKNPTSFIEIKNQIH